MRRFVTGLLAIAVLALSGVAMAQHGGGGGGGGGGMHGGGGSWNGGGNWHGGSGNWHGGSGNWNGGGHGGHWHGGWRGGGWRWGWGWGWGGGWGWGWGWPWWGWGYPWWGGVAVSDGPYWWSGYPYTGPMYGDSSWAGAAPNAFYIDQPQSGSAYSGAYAPSTSAGPPPQFYCPDSGYYPAVSSCPKGWLRVIPANPAPQPPQYTP